MPAKLEISATMFAIMRAIREHRDAYHGCVGKRDKDRKASTVNALNKRRLITHTNVIAEPWRLTKDGAELLRLRELGEQRLEDRERRAWGVYGIKR